MTRGPWSRAVLAVALVAVLMICAAALGWYVVIPNWRPPLAGGEVYGLDVSHHQGDINWRAVAADGIAFTYIKATEGGDFSDERFLANSGKARAAGLRTGPYHFFTLCTDGRKQAQHFLKVAPPDPMSLPPALDLEFGGNCSRRPAPDVLRAEVAEFVQLVEEAWNGPVLFYVFHSFEVAHGIREIYQDRPMWIRSYPLRPRQVWAVWQLHGEAHVDGVRGRVDLNVGRLEDLSP